MRQKEKRDSNFFEAKKSTVQSVDFLINSWLGIIDEVRMILFTYAT